MDSQKPLQKWQTTSSKYLVSDQWLKLRADTCITPAGAEITPYYVMEYPDWVSALILSDDNEVTLLRHYRHGVDEYILELVAGNVDAGETPEQALIREMEEEVGLTNAKLYPLGSNYANPSNHSNQVHNFLVLGGTFTGQKHTDPGATFEIIKMSLDDLLEIINRRQEIMQGLQLATIFLALNYLKANPNLK